MTATCSVWAGHRVARWAAGADLEETVWNVRKRPRPDPGGQPDLEALAAERFWSRCRRGRRAGTGGLVAACGSGIKGAGSTTSGTINIGFITPLTGQLAGFASGDQYVLSQIGRARSSRAASRSAARPTRST